MKETITLEQYQMFLELAPTYVLQETGAYIAKTSEHLSENAPEFEALAAMLAMLFYEIQLRQVEPLWRKAKRFAIRNSVAIKEAGKIAACIGVGVLLGINIDNR
jgi:hypothetical protein